MPVQLYTDDDSRLLSIGTKITLYKISGAIDEAMCGLPKEVKSDPGDDMISLTEQWVFAFRTNVQVPEDCISFAWQRIDHLSYQVSVAFTALSDARRTELIKNYPVNMACAVCTRPLVALHSCVRCLVKVCARCEVRTKRRFKCFFCLKAEELVQAKEDYPLESFRMSLLLPDGAIGDSREVLFPDSDSDWSDSD